VNAGDRLGDRHGAQAGEKMFDERAATCAGCAGGTMNAVE
jgi:hypothetical protein